MRLRFYVIARHRRGYPQEYYASINRGAAIGWTDDPDHCWSTVHEEWAEAVREALHRNGHFDTFVQVFVEEIRIKP